MNLPALIQASAIQPHSFSPAAPQILLQQQIANNNAQIMGIPPLVAAQGTLIRPVTIQLVQPLILPVQPQITTPHNMDDQFVPTHYPPGVFAGPPGQDPHLYAANIAQSANYSSLLTPDAILYHQVDGLLAQPTYAHAPTYLPIQNAQDMTSSGIMLNTISDLSTYFGTLYIFVPFRKV